MGWSEWKNFGSMSLLKEVSYLTGVGYIGKYFNFDLSDISGYQNLVLFENFFPVLKAHVFQNRASNNHGTDPGQYEWSYNNSNGTLTLYWNNNNYSDFKTYALNVDIYG